MLSTTSHFAKGGHSSSKDHIDNDIADHTDNMRVFNNSKFSFFFTWGCPRDLSSVMTSGRYELRVRLVPHGCRAAACKPLSPFEPEGGIKLKTMRVTHDFKPIRLPCALGVAPYKFSFIRKKVRRLLP